MPRKKRTRSRKTENQQTEYGQLGRTKRLLLAALKVWEIKRFGKAIQD